MSLASELKLLYHLTLAPNRGKTHAERLESFYGGQAEGYDGFRKRLLKGREELFRSLAIPEGGVWLDMGGGTGWNLEQVGERIRQAGKVYLVDLSTSLLKVARERFAKNGWTNAEAVEADATTYVPPEKQVDLVTFSYSLTMIPDWFAAIDQAERLLKPGGTIGVVDFYVSRKHAESPRARHSWLTRSFWPVWFANDNVFPSPDHLPYLSRKFEPQQVGEYRARLPYLPGSRAPYYQFIGRKR